MPATARGTVVLLGLVLLGACNGGGQGSGDGNPTPGPGPAPQNPCLTAIETDDAPATAAAPVVPSKRGPVVDRHARWRVLEALWTHREAELRRAARGPQPALEAPAASGRPGPRHADVGDIAVIQDTGDLVLPANILDLSNVGLRFSSNGAGGYDVTRIDAGFRQSLGSRLTLTDDDSAAAPLAFDFAFFGSTQREAFVNSDGNITFQEGDRASTDRNVPRLLTGPPRVAPFLADLDPTTGNGRIFVNAASDQYTVTWCAVRGFDSSSTVTVQTTLLPGGTIEFKYLQLGLADAVIGVSPGRTGIFTPVNLSEQGPTGGGAGAVGERFSARGHVDTVALAKAFYRSHPDDYDQLVVWTDLTYVEPGMFAYEQTVKNEIQGIGLPQFDLAGEFGSAGRLRSMAMMDAITRFPDDPTARIPGLGENNTLSVLGQEVGHRWLVFVEFLNHERQRSDQLLGRDGAHWSFFVDSDASVMEGNDIEEQGGGSFRTVAAVQRYSLVDQYLMGLVPPTAVLPFFYVENPSNVTPASGRESAPRVNVTFSGTKRDVRIDDIIAVHGERNPSAADSVHRQAFIFMVTGGRSPEPLRIDQIDRIRRAWEGFFREATSGRMTADTRLF